MTHQNDYTFAEDITERGLEAVPEMMRVLINQAMQVERSKYLQADEYERTKDRKGHANGYKPKTVRTRMGEITFAVPQVREGGFYPSALEKGLRSERALMITLAEMYVQGVSTRKVKAITEQLCGIENSAMQVSRAAAQLDEVLQQWRERPLDLRGCPLREGARGWSGARCSGFGGFGHYAKRRKAGIRGLSVAERA